MDMPPFHRRLLEIALEVTDSYGFALAGGYAMRAHGVVDRPSRDLDFVTVTAPSIPDAVEAMAERYRSAGLQARITRGTPLLGQLIVTDPVREISCPVDLMKLPLQRPPVTIGSVAVASLDDMAGMKVAALHGRTATRDMIDVASIRDYYGHEQLEHLGTLFEEEFQLEKLAMRLEEAVWDDVDVYMAYGLTEAEAQEVRRFALEWHEDLGMRLLEGVVEFD